MNIYNHCGVLILLIVICNMIELFFGEPDTFDNKHYEDWWVPTGSAIILFITIEFFILGVWLINHN